MDRILNEIADRVSDVKSIDNSINRARRDVEIDMNKVYMVKDDPEKNLEFLLETCSTIIDDMDRLRVMIDDLLENLYFLREEVDYERVRQEVLNKKAA